MKRTWTDEEIISNILDGKESGLVHLYTSYKSEFLTWLSNFGQIDKTVAADVYQDAVIVLRQNIVEQKYNKGVASLKTYLFGIGKNLFYNANRKTKNMVFLPPDRLPEPILYKVEKLTDQQLKVKNAVLSLGEPCKSILKMFYYYKFSMEVIAERLGYKNKTVAKSQKVRCVKQLRQKIME